MKQWLIFIFLVMFSLSVCAIDSDINILKVSCWDTGKLKLVVDSSGYLIDSNTIEAKATFLDESDGEEEIPAFYFPLESSERYISSEENITLESNEAVFNWSGMYRLSISYDKDGEIVKFPYSVGCPGLLISCKAAKLEILDCSNEDGEFEAEVVVNGLDILEGTDQIENVEFSVDGEDLPAEFSTTNKEGNIYVISGKPADSIESITAKFKYNDCEIVSEKSCDIESVPEDNLVSGAATNEIAGEMVTELNQKRQEVADQIKQSIEEYGSNRYSLLKWGVLIVGFVSILFTGMYILFKRKANKKPNFVKF